jgi:hypothetical protein
VQKMLANLGFFGAYAFLITRLRKAGRVELEIKSSLEE